MNRLSKSGLLLALAIVGLACSAVSPRLRPELESDPMAELEGSALLLLMSDQLLFEPFGVRQVFRHHPELHPELALTLGRIGDPRGLPYLESLLADPSVNVRRAAAFGLGLLGELRAFPGLLGALGDPDREVGRLAADALTRIELPLERILPALEVLPETEGWLRLGPSLFRFSADEIHRVEAAMGAVAAGEPELERWLLYALARSGDRRGLTRLRAGLEQDDPWLCGWAARALGRLGDSGDLERLATLLVRPEPGVVIQALRAAAALIDSGRSAAASSWVARLAELTDDSRTGVRLAAVQAAGSWRLEGALRDRLLEIARGDGRAAELALASLARAGDVESEQATLAAAQSTRVAMRRAAVEAASELGLAEVLDRLGDDPEASVRMASLAARLATPGDFPEVVAREALLDADSGVRVVALDWLTENPVAPYDELVLALPSSLENRIPELKVSGVRALAARAEAEPLERGAALAALERLAQEGYLARRAAHEALEQLGGEAAAVGTVSSSRKMRSYRQIASATAVNRYVELATARGRIVIELECPTAPLTCLNFLQLVRAGFFDGLAFHRVIPDFVAQGGDPRGDGWGGPGFTLRDENNRIAYERGVVGMARSDTHTAGSQFFLTLSSQPHLDGRYTAFGRVVEGDEFLDLIEQGDVILFARAAESRDAVSGSLR